MIEGQGHGEKLTRHRDAAIGALLAFPTIREAAENVGVHEATLRRWLKDDHRFRRDFQEARREQVEYTTTRLSQAGVRAVAALESVLEDTDAPATAKVSAARAILDLSYRGLEINDLAERVAELEGAISR